MEQNFQIVVANVGKPRRETLNGRDFLVAPATLIVGDAVLNGSQGALLYPSSENERDPQAWNGMPLVAWHPTKVVNGVRQHVSARNPEILNEWGLGYFYHANALDSHVDGNLDGEAWFDVENVKAVDAKLLKRGVDPILPRLVNGHQIELSTGLFTKNKQADPGVRNAKGDPYTGIATNYRPDHVAILPDEVGACSVDHGCGVNNQAGVFRSVINAVAKVLGIKQEEQLTDNAWSDAAREAAAEARRASSAAGKAVKTHLGREVHPVVIEASAAATAATKAGGSSPEDQMRSAAMHEEAAKKLSNHGQEPYAKMHMKAAEAHKKVALHLEDSRLAVNAKGDTYTEIIKPTANSEPWTDADFEAVLNARMCWGRPCDQAASEASSTAKEASDKAHSEDTPEAHAQAAEAHRDASAIHSVAAERAGKSVVTKGSFGAARAAGYRTAAGEHEAKAAEHDELAKLATSRTKQPTSNQEKRTMPLTKIQRTKMVQQLTTNCACKIKPAVLNEMDDDALEQTANAHNLILVVNAAKANKLPKVVVNAEGEGEAVPGVPWVKLAGILGIETDPRSDPVAFAAELKNALNGIVSKLGGDAAPPSTDEPTPGDAPTVSADPEPEPDEDDDMTGNRRAPQPQLTREQREDLAFAANMKREHKVGLVRRLLEHVPLANRKARGDKLFKLSIAELEDRIADLPVENERQPQQPQIDWSLAGGGSRQTLNSEDQETDAATVELMTNADEEYRQMILKAKTA